MSRPPLPKTREALRRRKEELLLLGAQLGMSGVEVPGELAEELVAVEEALIRLAEQETPGAKKRSTA